VLPDTLEIHVTEHEATAVLLAGTFYLVDHEGRPFKLLGEGERGALPVITGLSALQPLRSPERSQSKIQRAVEILDAYRAKKRPRLSEINIDDNEVATLYTAELGTQLRLGRENVEAALSRYDALRAALGSESDKLAIAHLDAVSAPDRTERVVASFFPAQDVPAFVVDAEERTKEKAAEAEAAAEKKKAKHQGTSKGHKKKSRLPKYE
jgi:cell division septal protein FtsQ